MNLKDLNNINLKDLQNVDWKDLQDRAQNKPEIIINIVLILVTLAVVGFSYQKGSKTVSSLEKEIKELKEKSEAVRKSTLTTGRYNAFMSKTQKFISGDQLIEKLSEFAIRRNVQILTFSPANEKNNNFITLTNIKINVASEDYTNIILFMRDIETSPFLIRVGSWEANLITTQEHRSRRSRSSKITAPKAKNFIEASVEIESIKFKKT